MNSCLLNVKILTLFPELFPGPLDCSVIGRALKEKIWSLEVINIRDFTTDKHRTVDDTPIGGGPGMVMKPDVLERALLFARQDFDCADIYYLSPRGPLLDQRKCEELAQTQNLILICGRFEGIDQRFIDYYQIKEISIGNFVMTGGEIAAYALIDSCVRTMPGVLNNTETCKKESFGSDHAYQNLVEYPQYTKPLNWNDMEVPQILLSGNHRNIEQWKLDNAKAYTQKLRPDLWELYLKKHS